MEIPINLINPMKNIKIGNKIDLHSLTAGLITLLKELAGPDGFEAKEIVNRKDRMKSVIELNVKWPNWGMLHFILDLKADGYPSRIKTAYLHLREVLAGQSEAYGMILAPYVSPESAEICRQYDIGFYDASGNCLLSHSPIHIDIRNRNRLPEKKTLKSIFSGKAARVLHVIFNYPGQVWTVKSLSIAANVSESEAYQVKKYLLAEEYIKTDGSREPFSLITNEEIIRSILNRWVVSYDFLKQHRFHYFESDLTPIILEDKISDLLTTAGIRYAFTATSAQRLTVDAIRYNCAFLYVDNWQKVESILNREKQELGLRESVSGGAIALIEPADDGVLLGMKTIRNLSVVSDIQAYLDLHGYPSRGIEAAEAILNLLILKK